MIKLLSNFLYLSIGLSILSLNVFIQKETHVEDTNSIIYDYFVSKINFA